METAIVNGSYIGIMQEVMEIECLMLSRTLEGKEEYAS